MKALPFYIFICISLFLNVGKAQAQNVYVATTGSDGNTGTQASPFKTMAKAKEKVSSLLTATTNANINVFFRGGTYPLTQTLNFNGDDLAAKGSRVTYQSYTGEKAVISGGTTLPHEWVKNNGSIWTLKLDNSAVNNTVVRQLFLNNTRLQRATSKILYTQGPINKYVPLVVKGNFKTNEILRSSDVEAFCSFAYNHADLAGIKDLSNAELILYNSWETSWHEISKVDTEANEVRLTNPTEYAVGFFSPRLRYRIENSRDLLDTPGQWYFNKESNTISYFAKTGENPNQLNFVAPVVETMLNITGNKNNGYLVFKNIDFKFTKYPVGITTFFGPGDKKKLTAENPWLNFNAGYASPQAAIKSGQAIYLTGVQNCVFQNCLFDNLGAYAINFDKYCNDNLVSNCTFTNLGSGAVSLGFDVKKPVENGIPQEASPSGNVVANCTIHDCGKVHFGAVGILIMQANHSVISNNTIYNMPYTGISCGWTWGFAENYTKANTISYNEIHDVMQTLADGGGIYTLGPQENTAITNNHIYNITRNADAVGSFNNGIFFDEGSSLMRVDSNVVQSVTNEDYRFNKTSAVKMRLGLNYFQKNGANSKLIKAVMRKAGKK